MESISLFGVDESSPPPVVRTTLSCDTLRDHVIALAHTRRVISFDTALNGGPAADNKPIAKGVIQVSATLRNELLDLQHHRQSTSQSFAVYWLPWSASVTNFVSWGELDQCGANCFMTVPLSGCCVVVADTGIVHVTADAYRYNNGRACFSLSGDSEAIGEASWPQEYTWGLQDWDDGYRCKDIASRGMVFGFQVSAGTWRIYFLARIDEDGKYTWTRGVQAE